MGKTIEHVLNTKPKLISASVFSLVLAYVLASFAVDSGSLWLWGGAIVVFIYFFVFIARTLKIHGKK